MNKDLQAIFNIVQHALHLSEEEKNEIINALKSANKELEVTFFKLERTEKVKHTTAILLEETIEELESKRKSVEAQNKELEIESSLERVRTVAMSMNKPDDMLLVCKTISEQLGLLKVKEIRNVQTAIFYKERGIYMNYEYYAKHNKTVITETEYTNHQIQKDFAEKMQKGNGEFYTSQLTEAEVKDWLTYQKTTNVFIDEYLNNASSLNYYWYSLGSVALGISTYKALNEEEQSLFKRFLRVFELSYRRYLDIEKAEAQAREARVEASLEKVRAIAMSMNRPDDLLNVCEILFKEFAAFGFAGLRNAMVNIHDDDNRTFVNYDYSDEIGKSTNHLTYDIHPVIKKQIAQIRSSNDAFSETVFSGRDLEDWKKFRKEIGEKDDPRLNKSTALYYYFYSIGSGSIGISTFGAIDEEKTKLLKRFRNVFNLSYQRYLDLALAETQAKEARIEAALERVRSRSMGMQKSEELKEVIQVVFDQFAHLNIHIEHTGFIMDYKSREDMSIWLADNQKVPSQITIPYFNSPHWNSFREAKEKGLDFFANYLNFEEKNKFYRELFEHIPGLPQDTKEFYLTCPGLAISTVLLDNVGLCIENFSATPYTEEENKTLMRFGKVFQQTYTRFLDLEKAEAQALEVQKRASVDRVRAEIASMRTKTDLERITPLIWNELNTLGVPFIRCGVFIMDEDQQIVHTFLSTPDGKAIASLHVPFGFDLSIITNGIKHWGNKKRYKEHWDANQFVKSWTVLSSLGETAVDNYSGEQIPESLYLHMLPFLQGMLYVGNDALLTEEDLQLVQNLADAFSTAYARYDDFIKLEAAKLTVEKTLVDLKQAQQQLVQSEKMASLGELTAGIAHEIQNPLNFVNNFSELNRELLSELAEEAEKGNTEEVKVLANDIRENEEKINQHGKRADAIVKGMLQHSRSRTGAKELTDVNELVDEYLRLAYHGLRAKDNSFSATIKTDFDESFGKINIIPQDIGRVLLNLFNNAFYAVTAKKKSTGSAYEPIISVSTRKAENRTIIAIKDNGTGIPQKMVDKIFQPFFTTKPTGQGTGLGLSLSYDIIKAHGGEIEVNTKEEEYTEFVIQLQS
jgi:signal transduction histidine kinase